MKVPLLVLSVVMIGLVATMAGSAEPPIKIGALYSLSGPAAAIGTPTKLVTELVVRKINKEGGINGRQIELVVADTKSDPANAAIEVRRFINEEKVAAIIGPDRTDLGMAVKRLVEEAGVPTFMTVGGDPVIMGGEKLGSFKWTFKSPQRSSTAVQKLYQYLSGTRLKKVALITASDGFGEDGKAWLTKLAPKFGLSIVEQQSFRTKNPHMNSQLTRMAEAKPDAMVCWTIGPSGAKVAHAVKQLGIKAPLFQCHGLPGPEYVDAAGPGAEGNMMPSTKLMAWQQLPDTDPQKPVIEEFVRLYKEAGYDKQFPINAHSGYAWDAICIVVNAMKNVGTEPEKLRDAIEQTKGYVGISGTYNLSPEDHNGLGVDSMIMVRIEHGEWKLLQ
ncbi:MAG: ABC transporter substrate-binding protein [Thermodesulfobacteriota bacterium]